MWRQCRRGSWFSVDLMKCSTRSFRLPTVHRSEGRITPLSFSSFSSKSLFSFLSMKREFLFYIRPVSFFLCATQSEGSNHSVPTKKNLTNCWTGNKKNGSTLCNSTVLKRQTESSCHTWTASVFTAISDWSENQTHGQSLSSPLLTKNIFHPFLIRKERKVS